MSETRWVNGREMPIVDADEAVRRKFSPPEPEVSDIELLGGDPPDEPIRGDNTFRNTDDAMDELRDRQKYRSEKREDERAREAEQREAEVDAGIREAREWAESDRQVLSELQQRAAAFDERQAALAEAHRQAQQHPDQVRAEHRRQLQQVEAELAAERQQLEAAAQQVQTASQTKAVATEQRKLYRDIPQLADAGTRKAFIDWAVKEKGIPRDVAVAETRRDVVSQVWAQYQREQAERREQHLARPRALKVRAGPLSAAGASPTHATPEEMRARLARTGSPHDAAEYLRLKRERRMEAKNGQ